MKKIVYGLLLLITVLLLTQCESEKMIPGEVGLPVYLIPDIETSSDTSGCTFNWTFAEKPTTSTLNILSFQPSSNGYNIYFIPDAAGDFLVKCEVLSSRNTTKDEQLFRCKIKPNQDNGENSVISGSVSEKTPELAPVYLEDSNNDDKQKETPKYESVKEVVKAPAQKPVVKQPVSTPTSDKGLYTIQISSFKTYANAEKELNELKKMGMQDIFIKKTYIKSKDEVWYRIRTNSFATISEAKTLLEQIKTKYRRKTAWIDKID